MIKAVLFDFDGTVVDSLKHIHPSWKKAFAQQGVELSDEEVVRNVFYATWEERIAKYKVDKDALYAAYLSALGGTLENYEMTEHIDVVLRELRAKGVKTAIVTAGKAANVQKVLTRLELDTYFDHILSAQDVARPKPYPDVALKAMELLGIAPEETVMIGDSEADVLTGKNAGIRTGFYHQEHNRPYSLSPTDTYDADFVFTHYSQLLEKLGL